MPDTPTRRSNCFLRSLTKIAQSTGQTPLFFSTFLAFSLHKVYKKAYFFIPLVIFSIDNPKQNKDKMRNFAFAGFVLVRLLLAAYSTEACEPSGHIKGTERPAGQCNTENNSDCCRAGKNYTTYDCSPPVSQRTKAVLYLNSFQEGGDGGAPSSCDRKYHSDDTLVVALSTGWFRERRRCLNHIVIRGNGRSVRAKVVDECDSTAGCDEDNGYQPPCPNNIVNASKAVWKALGVPEEYWGELDITWSDALVCVS